MTTHSSLSVLLSAVICTSGLTCPLGLPSKALAVAESDRNDGMRDADIAALRNNLQVRRFGSLTRGKGPVREASEYTPSASKVRASIQKWDSLGYVVGC